MDRAKIGKRLKKLRGKIPKAEVAEKCGISVSSLAMYETGRRLPRDPVKVKLAELYQKSVEEIFFTANVTKGNR